MSAERLTKNDLGKKRIVKKYLYTPMTLEGDDGISNIALITRHKVTATIEEQWCGDGITCEWVGWPSGWQPMRWADSWITIANELYFETPENHRVLQWMKQCLNAVR